jgi:predicted metal-dependent phosphotriesterase family hydrolase
MKRRVFLQSIPALAVAGTGPSAEEVMTVRGRIRAARMGVTLTHEHLLANFTPHTEGAKEPVGYDRDEVVKAVLPYLTRIRDRGCKTFVDATAVGLGRDVRLLQQLSKRSGLNILTTTGNYAAAEYRFLPQYVYNSSPETLARRWIDEWTHGIDGTDVRPGFIKLGFNGRALSDVEKTLIRAGAIAHRETGLTIGAHTGPAVAAFEQLAILTAMGVHPSAWIWIHAQNEKDLQQHVNAAKQGAWISFDGIGPDSIDAHVGMVANLRDHGLIEHALISQDAGWYSVGEPNGGTFRPFDTVFTTFIPALRNRGFTQADIDTLLVRNPAKAFSIAGARAPQ